MYGGECMGAEPPVSCPPAATTVRGRSSDSPARYPPAPTLSACRSSQACSSLTGISLRRPRRTSRTSGSICARQVSHDTPSASHACSTLSARVGALRLRPARIAVAGGEIGAIADVDRNLLLPATQFARPRGSQPSSGTPGSGSPLNAIECSLRALAISCSSSGRGMPKSLIAMFCPPSLTGPFPRRAAVPST